MKKVYLDQMTLTTCCPTTAGSKMLESFVSPFSATVVEKLKAADFEIGGKVAVGEFAIDLVGETAATDTTVSAKGVLAGGADAVLMLDVNGAPRRIAAQNGFLFAKPTYGIVSRFGMIPVACSGECVGVMASSAADCRDTLSAIVGKDDRDGTMHTDEICHSALADGKEIKKVALLGMGADSDAIKAAVTALTANGITVTEVDAGDIAAANAAWNILMSAELCNNVSRYDGIKYGYRTKNYKNLDELYKNSRSEAFGELLKTAILYGSDVLSTKNYMAKYDKALRVRRVIVEAFAKLFAEFDAVLMPAVSKPTYTKDDSAFVENKFTAPASITGLPAVVVGGVQLMGAAFTDGVLLSLAALLEKEGK